MPKITKRSVDAFMRAGPDAIDRWLWDADDGALKGFGLRMTPSAHRAHDRSDIRARTLGWTERQ
jgi:hypothetical protein